MFAALVIERARLTWDDFAQWPLVSAQMGFGEYWVQWVGGFAAVGLLLWLLAGGYRRLRTVGGNNPLVTNLFLLAVGLAVVAYAPYVAVILFRWLLWLFSALGYTFRVLLLGDRDAVAPAQPVIETRPWHRYSFTLGGFGALVAVLLPFALGLADLRWRRVWAMARLTVKEVVRRRILWVFAALALVFLFGAWFIDTKPEHQVHSYVGVVYLAMAVLLLLTGSLLASFSLPTDIRQQTIHTILTKPVERLEVVIGRFLGFMLVMTAAIAVMSGLSLVYVLRGVDPDAARESLRSRVPLTGELVFEGADDPRKGTNVGEEWDYRGYISGKSPGKPLQYAVWSLRDRDLPADLGARAAVPCEFTFNIYRTTKASPAEEGKGVFCTFLLTTAFCPLTRSDAEQPWVPARQAEIEAERNRLGKEPQKLTEGEIARRVAELRSEAEGLAQAIPNAEMRLKRQREIEAEQKDLGDNRDKPRALNPNEIADRVAEQFGVFEVRATPVFNFHTQGFAVPGGLFRNQLVGQQELQKRKRDLQAKGQHSLGDEEELRAVEEALRGARAPLQVRARCDSRTQFLGMAQYDFYLLAAEQPFALNFFKGSLGLWFWVCLATGLAVACSTYLSGVITWLCVGFLFLMGMFREYAQAVIENRPGEGGGPMESMIRLFTRQVPAAPLDETTVKAMATYSDQIFRWFLKLFLAVFPDVDRYDFSSLVSNGFNVPVLELGLTALYLAGYLLPWLVLAYYLVRSREVATW
jgi:hypothetical protein